MIRRGVLSPHQALSWWKVVIGGSMVTFHRQPCLSFGLYLRARLRFTVGLGFFLFLPQLAMKPMTRDAYNNSPIWAHGSDARGSSYRMGEMRICADVKWNSLAFLVPKRQPLLMPWLHASLGSYRSCHSLVQVVARGIFVVPHRLLPGWIHEGVWFQLEWYLILKSWL